MKRKGLILLFIFAILIPTLAFADTITLAWDPPLDFTPAGYKIYYGTASGSYSYYIDVGNVTQTTVPDLSQGQTYYFAATDYDAHLNESSYSNEVNKLFPDTTPPSVLMTSPPSGTISGTVIVSASALDNVAVSNVQFKLDGLNLGSQIPTFPYSMSWDTTKVSNGNHAIQAIATDTSNNQSTSPAIPVTVANAIPDTTPPTESITSPTNGSTISGTITIQASASDNVAVANVQFVIDGVNFGSPDTSSPYSISWNTTSYSNGNHTIQCVATDTSGNKGTSTTISVTVYNIIPVTKYTITASHGSGGSISPSGSIKVNKGSNITFNITPNRNYRINQVIVDNVNKGAISSFTFTNVQANHTIKATFKRR